MPVRSFTALVIGAIALAACTPDDSPPDDPVDIAADPIPSVTIPPARLTPFCQAMIDLTDRLESDPPDDSRALIIETYEDIADQVPATIEAEFAAVLARLRGEDPPASGDTEVADLETTVPPPATDEAGEIVEGDDFFEEGYSPDEDPALRVNAYVEFTCRDSVNNPGPPPTQPLEDVVLEDEQPESETPES